jgi:hypothetical protein
MDGVISRHGTLVGTAVTTVQLDEASERAVVVLNRSGTADMWVTYGFPLPADPTSGGANTVVVPAGLSRTLAPIEPRRAGGTVFVKLLGNGNAWSVEGVDHDVA